MIVIRRSMVPRLEPNWFHDWYKWPDGTWQIAFFGWLIYTTKRRKEK